MGDSPWVTIDRKFEGEPIRVGDREIQPVGHMVGKQVSVDGERGGFSGVKVSLTASEVLVREGEDEYRVPMANAEREPLRGILLAGMLVFAGCMLVHVVVNRITRGRAKGRVNIFVRGA